MSTSASWRAPRKRSLPKRAAAVLLAVFAEPPHDVVFVERAAHLRSHPGQIGLPGGSVDASDGDDRAATALRELQEELGVAPERVTIVGVLPTIENRQLTFDVTPVVGVLEPGTLLTIDHTETAAFFTIPLEEIVRPGALAEGVEVFGDRRIPTEFLDYRERHVWGLTARILRNFVDAWNAPESCLRREIERRLRPT
ncbi:MAG: CoA pyrophosphatase [Candidatus Eremiobacteraeota bacterium]|nr:CoA pyrophosphatase [Candidatus Eremiobacteraeota bacterium]MBV8354081.1 CoA pyrophosphatase [Candidatus Eremiobacteraeota bacterium]